MSVRAAALCGILICLSGSAFAQKISLPSTDWPIQVRGPGIVLTPVQQLENYRTALLRKKFSTPTGLTAVEQSQLDAFNKQIAALGGPPPPPPPPPGMSMHEQWLARPRALVDPRQIPPPAEELARWYRSEFNGLRKRALRENS